MIRVHQTLGPGFLENVYRRALRIDMCGQGLFVETEKRVTIYYVGHVVGVHQLDFLVEKTVTVEIKTVERLSRAHYAQVRSYLKATGLSEALLINFATELADFRHITR